MSPAPDVLIVDNDQDLVRSLQGLLADDGLMVRAFASAEAMLEELLTQSSCVVLDVRLPGMSGLALQERLQSRRGTPPEPIVTGATTVAEQIRAFHQGAFRVLQKPIQPRELLATVRDAIAFAIRRRSAVTASDVSLEALTERERVVLDLLVQDKSTRQIAKELAISSCTVEKHRTKIMAKMRVNSVVDLTQARAGNLTAKLSPGNSHLAVAKSN